MEIEKCAVAYNANNEILGVVTNGGYIFAPGDVTIRTFDTEDEMNAFIEANELKTIDYKPAE